MVASAAVDSRDEQQRWHEALQPLQALRADGKNLRRSRHLTSLYVLAEELGKRALASFRKLEAEEKVDLIHDLLAAKLEELVDGDRPRALWITMVKNRAIDETRKKTRHHEILEGVHHARTSLAGNEEDRSFQMDARTALESLPERDRQIVVAVQLGENREDIAALHRLSRAAVDQIVSRVKRRWKESQ